MSVVVAMSVVVTMIVAAILVARCHYSCNRVSELLDSCLESCFRSLGSVILDIHGLMLERNLEVLHTLLECDVLLNLVYAVLAVEVHAEGHFLDFCFLLRAC